MLLRSLFVCILLAALNKVVVCNHYGYGTISWSKVGNSTYQISFLSAWRKDYPWPEGVPTTTVGSPGNIISIGSVYFGTTLLGTPALTWNASPQVTSILRNGYFIGEAYTTITLPRSGIWYVWYIVCCRSGALQLNNSESTVTITARIPTSVTYSPVVTGFPFTVMPMGTTATYSIPAFSPLMNPLTYSFFTSSTYTGLVSNPGIPGPWNFNSLTGQLTWTTPACCEGNQYAYQFLITDSVTSAYIVVDATFQLGLNNATTSTPTISPSTTSIPTPTSSQAPSTTPVQPTLTTTTWTPPTRPPTTPTTSGVGILSFRYSYSFFDLIFTSSSINVSPSQAVYDVLVPARSLLKGVTVELDAAFLANNHIAGVSYSFCLIGTPPQQCANQPLTGITVCDLQTFQCSSSAFIPVSERDVVVNIQLGQQHIQVSVYDNA